MGKAQQLLELIPFNNSVRNEVSINISDQNKTSLALPAPLTTSNHVAFGGRFLVIVRMPELFPYGHILASAGEVIQAWKAAEL